MGSLAHNCFGQCQRIGPPRSHSKSFENGLAVPIESSVWEYLTGWAFDSHTAGDVLNCDVGNFGGWPKSPNALENL